MKTTFYLPSVLGNRCNTTNISPLSKEDELILIAKFQAGDSRAANRVIKSNFGLVMRIVNEYSGESNADELISVAFEGITIALYKFDVRKNFRFMTYASWWITKYVSNSYKVQKTNNGGYNKPLYYEDDMKVCSTIADIPDENVYERLMKTIELLPERRKVFLLAYYGLDDSKTKKTFEELGQLYGISKPRAHQICKDAVEQLQVLMRA